MKDYEQVKQVVEESLNISDKHYKTCFFRNNVIYVGICVEKNVLLKVQQLS